MADSRIKVMGIGGAGCSTVESMLSSECSRECDLIAVNTDAASLLRSKVPSKFLLGKEVTKGRSTGNDMKLGEKAALYDQVKLASLLSEADVAFLVAGLGGGTGAGASPVIASLAKAAGAVVVSFATMPFQAEGKVCAQNASYALSELKHYSDLIVLVQSDKILELTHSMPITEAFLRVNEVRLKSMESMVQVMLQSGLEEIKPVLKGFATIGVGTGEDARTAAENSLRHLLIVKGVLEVSGVLVSILKPASYPPENVIDAVEYMSSQFREAKLLWISGEKNNASNSVDVISLAIGLNPPL